MKLTDIVIILNEHDHILSIDWKNEQLKKVYKDTWDTYINKSLESISDININAETLFWKDECFIYDKLKTSHNETFIILKRKDYKEYLYEQSFDRMNDGIQIYDKNSCVVYINKASKRISSISDDEEIAGKHLEDLYDLNNSYSTVLTTLRTQAPVINRFDNFKLRNGINITSVNTAYPIFDDKELVGAISFDQDVNVIGANIEKLEIIKKTMLEQSISFENKSKDNKYHFSDIIGKNKSLLEAIELSKKVSIQDCNILIYGETGTGKEMFAQSIHEDSGRKDKKFLAINCAAVPETLIESMLFGTTKGAFTGSVDRAGLLEEVNGGTLFLDELNSMSLGMQSKILRVIQENSFRRVGGEKDIHINVRFISSCNEDPYKITSENLLRKDLFYRLSTVIIEIPPLKNRIDDIEILIKNCLKQNIHKYFKNVSHIDESVIEILKDYKWPGNVRELYHVVEYALNVIEGNSWNISHLPKYITNCYKEYNEKSIDYSDYNYNDISKKHLQCIMDSYESDILKKVLDHHGFNISKTANSLGIKRQSLQYRIKKYGIIV
ncbi:MAG: rocR 3 [Bacillota bacterium]|jgi:arginine utilization regulatory protein|nr:rocR 3 [Bacillota bacterium]